MKIYSSIVVLNFLCITNVALHGMQLTKVKKPIHPLALECATMIQALNQQEIISVAATGWISTSLLCNEFKALIFEKLTEWAYEDQKETWFIKKGDRQKNNEYFVELYKKNKDTELPASNDLIKAYKTIFEDMQKGWLEVDSVQATDIKSYGDAKDYRVFIKQNSLPQEHIIFDALLWENKLWGQLEVSNIFYDQESGTNFFQNPNKDGFIRIYLRILIKRYDEILKILGLEIIAA